MVTFINVLAALHHPTVVLGTGLHLNNKKKPHIIEDEQIRQKIE